MISNIFLHFLAGVVLGFIATQLLFNDEPNVSKHFSLHTDKIEEFEKNEDIKSRKLLKKIRILCLINTCPKNHNIKAVHVKQTWGEHCDKLLFASTLTDVNLNTIGFNMTDAHSYVWGKEKLMLQYIYKNFFDHYDWYYKADDDTFANIENLRFLVSSYSTEDPIYLGYKYSEYRWGLMDGGAGILHIYRLFSI